MHMSSILMSLRDELISALRDTESQTADIFMVLAESLPSLVEEMRRSLERSQNALDCMDQVSHGCSDGLQITSLIDTTRREMEAGALRFQEMSRHDQQLFEELQAGVRQLQTIADSIKSIQMDSEDMELVSLNAMTVALKAGNAGRAFSYITEELKRLSNRTISLSESIFGKGQDLVRGFREIEESLTETRDFQNTLIEGFQTRIFTSFEDFRSAVDATISGLRRLQDESRELQEPVNGMMEAIQLQDLIRQSIDHIILALEAIQPEAELHSPEAVLDELAFTRQIPDLAMSLIDDVAGQIENSVQTFNQLISQAEQKRIGLEEDRERFVQGTAVEGSMPLDELSRHAASLLSELLNDLDENVRRKAALMARSRAITTEVQGLEDQFQTFTTLVNRFHNIDIASRIEVAKQDVLRAMGTTSAEMNALTKKIEADVEASLEATQEFIKSTSATISSHHTQFERERSFVESFSSDLRQRYHALEESREEVTSVVSDFSLFTTGFFRVFQESKENGVRLSALSTSLRTLTERLEGMRAVIEERYREALREQGLEEWTIASDRLQNIIDRFTIFAHKQRASEIAGFDVEEGVEAGEITLF